MIQTCWTGCPPYSGLNVVAKLGNETLAEVRPCRVWCCSCSPDRRRLTLLHHAYTAYNKAGFVDTMPPTVKSKSVMTSFAPRTLTQTTQNSLLSECRFRAMFLLGPREVLEAT